MTWCDVSHEQVQAALNPLVGLGTITATVQHVSWKAGGRTMLQTITTHTTATLGEVLDQMTEATMELDRGTATILAQARESMRALNWNRNVSRHEAASRRRRFLNRHKLQKGVARARV
jgi:hypothetical protein